MHGRYVVKLRTRGGKTELKRVSKISKKKGKSTMHSNALCGPDADGVSADGGIGQQRRRRVTPHRPPPLSTVTRYTTTGPPCPRGGGGVEEKFLIPGYGVIFAGKARDPHPLQNSIAFGSAPRREVDSQPISP